jgi:hypothetical protein
MAIKYFNIFQSEALTIFSQIGIFRLKTNHLATLMQTYPCQRCKATKMMAAGAV